ncbi:MAG: hypothetical protein M3082_16900 [Candidatus Dormibacteraeota bacterium]|nr:hypothetical protein [Candidatus Dormibacteraeota bacterium]
MSRSDSLRPVNEEAEARLFAAYIDDLFADREPSLVVQDLDDDPLEPEVRQELLMAARAFKGQLDPSEAGEQFKVDLRDRLAQLARAMTAASSMALHELLVAHSPDLDSRSEVRAATGLSVDQLRGLFTNRLAPSEIPAVTLLLLADALRIPGRVLLDSLRASATRWIEPLVRVRSAELSGLAHLAGRQPVRSHEEIRLRVVEELNEHAASLEMLVRAREAEQPGEGRS